MAIENIDQKYLADVAYDYAAATSDAQVLRSAIGTETAKPENNLARLEEAGAFEALSVVSTWAQTRRELRQTISSLNETANRLTRARHLLNQISELAKFEEADLHPDEFQFVAGRLEAEVNQLLEPFGDAFLKVSELDREYLEQLPSEEELKTQEHLMNPQALAVFSQWILDHNRQGSTSQIELDPRVQMAMEGLVQTSQASAEIVGQYQAEAAQKVEQILSIEEGDKLQLIKGQVEAEDILAVWLMVEAQEGPAKQLVTEFLEEVKKKTAQFSQD